MNSKAVGEYNQKMLSALTLIIDLMILLPLLAAPFNKTKTDAVPAYLLAAMIFLIIYLIYKLPVMKNYAVGGLYVCFSVFFIFSIYLSVVNTPDMRATVLLGAFCLAPLGIIDNPVRINSFIGFWLVAHSVLALYLKPLYALDDILNTVCFAIVGCFIGNMFVWSQLDNYEAKRLLIIEKETDVLTGIANRRKLYQNLGILEKTGTPKPSGIMMIDIDHFKDYNDNYGHAAGDHCLTSLGTVFKKFKQNFQLDFYRYGGEEFVAMAYGYGEKELFSIAESLRIAVQGADMDGRRITVSIGIAYCGDKQIKNYEKVIDQADKAVYEAKRTGRNKVCMDS